MKFHGIDSVEMLPVEPREGCRLVLRVKSLVVFPNTSSVSATFPPPIVNFPAVHSRSSLSLPFSLSFFSPFSFPFFPSIASFFPCPSLRLLLLLALPSFLLILILFLSHSLSAVLGRSSERHRYFPPVSQRQLTAAGRSPVPSCTAADKDPTAAEARRKRPRAGQSAGSPVAADCIGRAPVLLSSIPSVR